jgi:hypothetical protein
VNTKTNPRKEPGSGSASPHLNPKSLGIAFGATGLVFYLGCMLTMATVPHEAAVGFFNSLLHGIDVEPVLKTGGPMAQVAFGLIATFILGWFAGVLVAGIYNLSLHLEK